MDSTPVTKTKTFKIFFRTVSISNWLDWHGLCNIKSKFSQNTSKIYWNSSQNSYPDPDFKGMMWTEQNWIVYCSVIWSIIRGVAENMKFLFNFFHILFLQNDSSQPETSRGSAAPKSITRFELISALNCSSFMVLLYNGPCTCPDCKPSQSNPVNHLWLRISWTPPFWYPCPGIHGLRFPGLNYRVLPDQVSVNPFPNLLVGDRLQSDLMRSIAPWLISRFIFVLASRNTNWAMSIPLAIRW